MRWQLPERILQSEDARCVMVIYILRFIYFCFIYLFFDQSKFYIQHGNYIPMTFICNPSMFCANMFLTPAYVGCFAVHQLRHVLGCKLQDMLTNIAKYST